MVHLLRFEENYKNDKIDKLETNNKRYKNNFFFLIVFIFLFLLSEAMQTIPPTVQL